MKKVIVADPISKKGVELLKAQEGFEVIEAYGSTHEQIKELAKDASAIIVRSETKINLEVLEAGKNLKALGRAGVGVDNIDVKAATDKGIVVMNTPTGNTIATAELTFTHILCGTRPIPQANAKMQEGIWDRKTFKGSELLNKTLSVLGMGRIGTEVAKRAQAFNMKVLAYDPFMNKAMAESLGIEIVELEEAITRADYITVHMPLIEATKYMLDEKAFASMKDGVRVFNCARGGIIKETALIEALKSGKVAAAGLDVYEDEPIGKDSPLLGISNLVLTPHLGASTAEAQESCGIEVAELIRDVLVSGAIKNAVNTPSADAETIRKMAPYINLGEKLGTVIQQISPDRISKLAIKYFGKIAETDNTLVSLAIQKGYLKKISETVNDVNAPSKLKALGVEVEKSTSSVVTDYSDVIDLVATCEDGNTYSVSGTVLGKEAHSKILNINGQDIEVIPQNCLLLLNNDDVPGMVGKIGSLLGDSSCNIANMTVSRNAETNKALAVYELDEVPSQEVIEKLLSIETITNVKVVDLG